MRRGMSEKGPPRMTAREGKAYYGINTQHHNTTTTPKHHTTHAAVVVVVVDGVQFTYGTQGEGLCYYCMKHYHNIANTDYYYYYYYYYFTTNTNNTNNNTILLLL